MHAYVGCLQQNLKLERKQLYATCLFFALRLFAVRALWRPRKGEEGGVYSELYTPEGGGGEISVKVGWCSLNPTLLPIHTFHKFDFFDGTISL